MSSTHRGATRSPNDFYVTDPAEIFRFLDCWCKTDPDAAQWWSQPKLILDPCAGGLTEQVVVPQKKDKPPLVFEPTDMSYPTAAYQFIKDAGYPLHRFDTLDIRENSRAVVKGDFLKPFSMPSAQYDAVFTNPPFSLALEFLKKSLLVVKPGGYVVMLLRLNFFGSKERNQFFLDGNMPHLAYVHAKRLGFTPDGGQDSVEYCHMIWANTGTANYDTKLHVMPY